MKKAAKDYTAQANKYVADVLDGTIPACRQVIAACKRQQNDLAKQGSETFPYVYDASKGNRICAFIEVLTHVKGELAGQKIKLEPWQCFILTTCFGWVHKDSGRRRFRRSYLEVPRGNGKSALSSGVALFGLCADKEAGAEVVVAARVKEQTRFVMETSQQQVRKNKKLRAKFALSVLAKSIVQESSMSSLKALASEEESLDGLSVHLGIIDELHAHRTDGVYASLSTACAKRVQSMLWMITTAGTDQAGVCYAMHQFTERILDGIATDDSFFGIIFTIDPEDRWDTEDAWRKANPNWKVSVQPDAVAQECNRAKQIASQQASFKMKHLNLWMNADSTWLNMAKLQTCIDESLSEKDFEGQQCIVGVDLASKLDLCAEVRLFAKTIEDKTHFYAFGTYWLPEETMQSSTNAAYKGWAATGKLQMTSGSVTDLDFIEQGIRESGQRFKVRELAYDKFQSSQLMTHLTNEGMTCVEVPMNVNTLSPTMKLFEELVSSNRFHFNDPVLAWAITNVVCHRDVKQNIYPRKPKNVESKIDPLVALLLALSRTILSPLDGQDESQSVYKTRGILVL
jgi:phage terminase large subunit-like protein